MFLNSLLYQISLLKFVTCIKVHVFINTVYCDYCLALLNSMLCYELDFEICDISIVQFAYLASVRSFNEYMFMYVAIDMKM